MLDNRTAVIQSNKLTIQQRQRIGSLVSILKQFLKGETGHPVAPCSLFFASIGTEGHIGDAIIEMLLEASSGSRKTLDDLGQDDILQLGQKIQDVYCRVYGITAPFEGSLCRKLHLEAQQDSGRVRSFIKRMIAHLDDKYGPPKRC